MDSIEKTVNCFRLLDEEVQKHAITIKPTEIIFSNLVKLSTAPGDNQLLAYLHGAIFRIQATKLYQELNYVFDQYCDETDLYDGKPCIEIPGEVPDWIKNYQFEESDFKLNDNDLDDSVIGTWLRMSGYYEKRLIRADVSDWADKFQEFLLSLREKLGNVHLIVFIDDMFTDEISWNNTQLFPSEKLSEYIRNFTRNFNNTLASGYDPLPYFDCDDWLFLHRCVPLRAPSPGSVSEAPDPKKNLKDEMLILQLLAPKNLSFPNTIVLPASVADYNHASFKITKENSSWSWSFCDYIGMTPSDCNQVAKSMKLGEEDRQTLEQDLKVLTKSIMNMSVSMRASLDWYFQGCANDDSLHQLLLYVTALESMLIGKDTSELSEKFSTRCAKLFSNKPVVQDSVYRFSRSLYKIRSEITHGTIYSKCGNLANLLSKVESKFGQLSSRKITELKQDPASWYIRYNLGFDDFGNIVREFTRNIMLTGVALDSGLSNNQSEIHLYYEDRWSERPRRHVNEFVGKLHERPFDEDLWRVIYLWLQKNDLRRTNRFHRRMIEQFEKQS